MVNVIGLGYIGLPTALMLASHGVEVIGTDIDQERVASLRAGNLTFQEDGLGALYQAASANGIVFTTEYPAAEMHIIAVPTPFEEDSKKVKADYIIEAVKKVLPVCEDGTILVIESTISPGTIDKFIRPLILEAGLKAGVDIHLAHAPERIIPGNMIAELENNNRTIGADGPEIGEKVKAVYETFCRGKITVTDIQTAEMTKVVENTFRDINIAYANELAKICRVQGLDVYKIIEIANQHPRVNILMPGPGVGGHCIPIDPWFLVGDFPEQARLIRAAREVNDSMPDYVLERMCSVMEQHGITEFHRVGLYGLTYKANVDDVRDAPALQLIAAIRRRFGMQRLSCYDPMVKRNLTEGQYHDFDEFLNAVDFVVLLVDHDEIKQNSEKLKDKLVLDTRNICPFDGVYRL